MRTRIAFALCLVGAGVTDYAARIPAGLSGGLQRVDLPAAILAAAQEPGLADVRVFNAAGEPLAMALAPADATVQRRETSLTALPILGSPGALNVTGVSLSVDASGRASVRQLDGTPGPERTVVLGVLFDTRAVADPARDLRLDADVPAQQPVNFRVEASGDLRAWQRLGDRTIYRSPGTAGDEAIAIGDTVVKGRYLRVTWTAASRLVAPVAVRGATLVTASSAAVRRPVAEITGAVPDGPHRIGFTLPFVTPVAALRIIPAGDNIVVPVRIMARGDSEQPWAQLGEGTAVRLAGRPSLPIQLLETPFRSFRIEADARTPGFTAPPRIEVLFDPVQIVVLAAGAPPFTVAAGQRGAAPAYLPLASLAPGNVGALPVVATTTGPATVAALPDEDTTRRTLLLWAALIGGVLLLGGLVWLLLRQSRPH